MDSETADPIDVQAKKVFETNSMVEEFMLAANISAAEKIFLDFPECAMLRRHPAPPPSNFDPLVTSSQKRQKLQLHAHVPRLPTRLRALQPVLAAKCGLASTNFLIGLTKCIA